jgi:cytochrome c-type biogenesis protein CcmH/NrfG
MAKRRDKNQPVAPKPTQPDVPVMSIRIEYVGVIAVLFMVLGAILGSVFLVSGDAASVRDLVEIGNAAYDANDPTAAVLAYEKALKSEPHNPDVLTDVGHMYLKLGQIDTAISRFLQAAAADPKHVKSRFNLGIAYMSKKDYAKAAEAFHECLSISPDGEMAAAAKAHLESIQKKLKRP